MKLVQFYIWSWDFSETWRVLKLYGLWNHGMTIELYNIIYNYFIYNYYVYSICYKYVHIHYNYLYTNLYICCRCHTQTHTHISIYIWFSFPPNTFHEIVAYMNSESDNFLLSCHTVVQVSVFMPQLTYRVIGTWMCLILPRIIHQGNGAGV